MVFLILCQLQFKEWYRVPVTVSISQNAGKAFSCI